MTTTIKTFLTSHKTTIMIACTALVIGAKSFSTSGYNNQQQMPAPQQQTMPQQEQSAQVPQGYNQQIPKQNINNEQESFYDSWFDEDNQQENSNGYNNQGNPNYSGYTTSGNASTNYNSASANNTYSTANNQADYTSGWKEQQALQDGQHERFNDYIRDETKYNDAEGNTYKLASGYDNNYVNTTNNTYIQTNDASFDPNVNSTSSYTAVTPTDYTPATTTGI